MNTFPQPSGVFPGFTPSQPNGQMPAPSPFGIPPHPQPFATAQPQQFPQPTSFAPAPQGFGQPPIMQQPAATFAPPHPSPSQVHAFPQPAAFSSAPSFAPSNFGGPAAQPAFGGPGALPPQPAFAPSNFGAPAPAQPSQPIFAPPPALIPQPAVSSSSFVPPATPASQAFAPPPPTQSQLSAMAPPPASTLMGMRPAYVDAEMSRPHQPQPVQSSFPPVSSMSGVPPQPHSHPQPQPQPHHQPPIPGQFGAAMHRPAARDFSVPPYVKPVHPNFLTTTCGVFPASAAVRVKSGVDTGCILTPLAAAPDAPLPVISPVGTEIIRCSDCSAYLNPYVMWIDGGSRWKCPLCGTENATPTEYFAALDPSTHHRIDALQRPELVESSVEWMAPAAFIVRPPMLPTFLFVLDFSASAVRSGALHIVCQVCLLESVSKSLLLFFFQPTAPTHPFHRPSSRPCPSCLAHQILELASDSSVITARCTLSHFLVSGSARSHMFK